MILHWHCAQFPLPIIAGIGHQRDLSIVDMVVHTSVKTPTAGSYFFNWRPWEGAKGKLTDTYNAIYHLLRINSNNQQQRISDISWKIKHALLNKTASKKIFLERQNARLIQAVRLAVNQQKNKLELLSKEIEHRNPHQVIRKGLFYYNCKW